MRKLTLFFGLLLTIAASTAQPPGILWTHPYTYFEVHSMTVLGSRIHLVGDDGRDLHYERYTVNGVQEVVVSYGTEWGSTLANVATPGAAYVYAIGTLEVDSAHDNMLLGHIGQNGIINLPFLNGLNAFRGDLLKRNLSGDMFAGGECLLDRVYRLLIKFTNTGDTLWTYRSLQNFLPYLGDIAPTADGGCMLFNPDDGLHIVKLSTSGATEWDSVYADLPGPIYTVRATAVENGNVVATFCAYTPPYPHVFVEFSPDGRLTDVRLHHVGDGEFGDLPRLLLSHTGRLICVTSSFDAAPVYALSADLNLLWTFSPRDHGIGFDQVTAAAVTSAGNVVISVEGFQSGSLIMLDTELAVPEKVPYSTADFSLSAFPNPFNGSSKITLTVPATSPAQLSIYDLLGREVQSYSLQPLTAGSHTFTFDGAALPTGIYVARAQSGDSFVSQKLLLLK